MPLTSTHLFDRYVRPNWKAVVGFLTPSATILASAVTEGSAGGTAITQAEWITALCAAFLTGGTVYVKGNKDPLGKKQDESVQPPDEGGYPDGPQDDEVEWGEH